MSFRRQLCFALKDELDKIELPSKTVTSFKCNNLTQYQHVYKVNKMWLNYVLPLLKYSKRFYLSMTFYINWIKKV